MHWLLWPGKTSQKLHSLKHAYGHWADNHIGLQQQLHKNKRFWQGSATFAGHAGLLQKRRSGNNQRAPWPILCTRTSCDDGLQWHGNWERKGCSGSHLNHLLLPSLGWWIHSQGATKPTKQTIQFKYEDITFFQKNVRGQLRCLPCNAPNNLIAMANGATLKLDNQQNGWKVERGVRLSQN